MARPWRVFYADGSVFSSDDGPPEASPPWGVVAIAQANDVTGHSVLGNDYFLHVNGAWLACDFVGMIDHCVHSGHLLRAFRVGRLLGTEEWNAVAVRAADCGLPPRSAYLPGERV